MQQNNLTGWSFDASLSSMLFFAQRVDELLFQHTTDTYRCMAVSLKGLSDEFCDVYKDSKAGLINEKNLGHIIEEFNDRLQKDPIAKTILSPEYVGRFAKNYGSWDTKTQHENVNYIGRKLSNGVYYDKIVGKLKSLIADNKEKNRIGELAALWVREIIDCGYNENYVYKVLHTVFFHEPVSSLESLNTFFNFFDFQDKKFEVYIGFSKDISALQTLFGKMWIRDCKISVMKPEDVPPGIKVKRQKTILRFESIKEYDMYSAFFYAQTIASNVVDAYGFFRHSHSKIRTYGQVVAEDKSVTTIKPQQLLKYRVSALSHEDSERNADALLRALFSNQKNKQDLKKIATIHNSAIYSESTNDSLLSLWSVLESLVENDEDKTKLGKPKDEKDKDAEKKGSRSKIGNIVEYILPFLKSTYIKKLVETVMYDIIRWDKDFFDCYIRSNGFGSTDLEHTFAFLTFQSTQPVRDELYKRTDTFPLLRNRVVALYEQLHNSTNIKSTLRVHEQRVRWHFYRIYRARNYIIHDAAGDEILNYELLINLHSYVDIVVSKLVELINNSPYNDTLMDILSEHKLEVSIMDEQLQDQAKVPVDEHNALRFLYYDINK